jgi:polyhydroxyalkanoate synthesis regulator phasin
MAKAKASAKKTSGAKPKARTRKAPASSAASRTDKSVQAYRDALDRSVTLSRERIQEVFDDAVERGRMTRSDANELIRDLEKLIEQARREVETRVSPVRKQASKTASRASKTVRDAAEPALARADQLRRRAGGPGDPITAYDSLTAAQVKARLGDLSKADLRKVRTKERAGKARKTILADIEKRL